VAITLVRLNTGFFIGLSRRDQTQINTITKQALDASFTSKEASQIYAQWIHRREGSRPPAVSGISRSYRHSAHELETAPDSGPENESLCSIQLQICESLGVIKMRQHCSFRNCLLVGALLLAGGTLMLAQDSAGQSAPASDNSASDNTKTNQQDRNSSQPTADQQSNTRSDRDLTQQIRQAITADKTFSTYAHNVKVITQGGQVTLRGPVRSEDEKRAVEAKAAALAGDGKVTSELTVKPKS